MRIARTTKRFRRDYARMKRSGKKLVKLHALMELLLDDTPLPEHCRDHALQGEWKHLRDCHVEGDWVLLYELGHDEENNPSVTFHATGTHTQLFE